MRSFTACRSICLFYSRQWSVYQMISRVRSGHSKNTSSYCMSKQRSYFISSCFRLFFRQRWLSRYLYTARFMQSCIWSRCMIDTAWQMRKCSLGVFSLSSSFSYAASSSSMHYKLENWQDSFNSRRQTESKNNSHMYLIHRAMVLLWLKLLRSDNKIRTRNLSRSKYTRL